MKDKILVAILGSIIGCLVMTGVVFHAPGNVYIGGFGFILAGWLVLLSTLEANPKSWMLCRANTAISGMLIGISITMCAVAFNAFFATGWNGRAFEGVLFFLVALIGMGSIVLIPEPVEGSSAVKTPSRI